MVIFQLGIPTKPHAWTFCLQNLLNNQHELPSKYWLILGTVLVSKSGRFTNIDQEHQPSHKQNSLTFHYTGCLKGILIIPIWLGSKSPTYPKQPVFFHCSTKCRSIFSKRWLEWMVTFSMDPGPMDSPRSFAMQQVGCCKSSAALPMLKVNVEG